MSTTSINDLPYDILYVIFTICWDKNQTLWRPSFPMIASHVCRKWRGHALETPEFWATLNFKHPTPQLKKNQLWLERSKDYPLDIALGGILFDQRSIKTAKEIMRLVAPHSNRWRTLKISHVPRKVIRVVFDRLLDIPMPSLMKLEVMATDPLSLEHQPVRTNWRFRPFMFGGAPNLQTMILGGMSYDHIGTRFTALKVFDTILNTGIGLEQSVLSVVHLILSQLPQLQSFRLRSLWYSYPRDTDLHNTQSLGTNITPSLLHGSLEELSISAPARIRNLLVLSLVLPKVRCFVDRTRPECEWEIGLGICCLPVIETARPFSNLISLWLAGDIPRYFWMSYGRRDPRNSSNLRSLQGALESLPTLRSLAFYHIDMGNEGHLGCLSRKCPNLELLSMICCAGYTVAELRSIVESRRALRGTDSLRRLAVYGLSGNWETPPELEEDALQWLSKEWNQDFVFKPEYSQEEPVVHSLSRRLYTS